MKIVAVIFALLSVVLRPCAGYIHPTGSHELAIRRAYARQDSAIRRKDAKGFYSVCTPDYHKQMPNGHMGNTSVASTEEAFEEFPHFKRVTRLLSIRLSTRQAIVRVEHRTYGGQKARLTRANLQSVEQVQDFWVRRASGWMLERSRRLSIR
jgi:hypothetical protein